MAILTEEQLSTIEAAVRSIWHGIAPDADVDTNEEAVELCLDAGMLKMYGYGEAYTLYKNLIQDHGLEVREELCERIELI